MGPSMGPSLGSAIGHQWGHQWGPFMNPSMGSIHGVHQWGPSTGSIRGAHRWGAPRLIQTWCRKRGGMLARKRDPSAVSTSCRLFPGLPSTYGGATAFRTDRKRPPTPLFRCPAAPHRKSPSLRCPPPVHRTLTMRCCGAGTTCSSSTSRVTCFRLVARDMAGRERPRAGAAPLPPQRAPSASGCVASLPPQGGRKGGYARIGCACPACRGRGAGTRSDWLCVPCVMSVGGGARL